MTVVLSYLKRKREESEEREGEAGMLEEASGGAGGAEAGCAPPAGASLRRARSKRLIPKGADNPNLPDHGKQLDSTTESTLRALALLANASDTSYIPERTSGSPILAAEPIHSTKSCTESGKVSDSTRDFVKPTLQVGYRTRPNIKGI